VLLEISTFRKKNQEWLDGAEIVAEILKDPIATIRSDRRSDNSSE
jgi:hypothetical protein